MSKNEQQKRGGFVPPAILPLTCHGADATKRSRKAGRERG